MSSFLKAKALAFLYEFEESIAILKKIGKEKEIEFVKQLQTQKDGDYYQTIADQKGFVNDSKILNYYNGVEIKMTKDKGRGVFATMDHDKGSLIVVEKAVALDSLSLDLKIRITAMMLVTQK